MSFLKPYREKNIGGWGNGEKRAQEVSGDFHWNHKCNGFAAEKL